MKAAPASDRISDFGIDGVCEAIGDGETMTSLAQRIGVSIGTLFSWLHADPERLARASEARSAVALIWDEKAEQVLIDAADTLGVAKARELAHHYRWRAAKIAPKVYGDRVTQEHQAPGGGPVAFVIYGERESEDASAWQQDNPPPA